MKDTLIFWVVNFIPVSIILAIFEIWLEKYKTGPWGATSFINPFWEKKLSIPVPFLQYISNYHAIMFSVVMPVLFIVSMWGWSMVLNYTVFTPNTTWYWSIASVSLLFAAIWLGNSGLEDFFYFAIQSLTGWHEPHALWKVVMEKDFAWFKDWLPPIFGLNIPGHWVFCPTAALILLSIRHWIVR